MQKTPQNAGLELVPNKDARGTNPESSSIDIVEYAGNDGRPIEA